MIDKRETQKNLKRLKKEIKVLRKQYFKLEFRPCQNDAELREKESELKALMERIYCLENEQDRFILNSARAEHDY